MKSSTKSSIKANESLKTKTQKNNSHSLEYEKHDALKKKNTSF